MSDTWRDRMRWVMEEYADGTAAELARQLSRMMEREVKGQTVSAWVREKGPTTPGGAFLEAMLRLHPTINPAYLMTGEGPRTRTRDGDPDAYRAGVTDAVAVVRVTLENITTELGSGRADKNGANDEIWREAANRLREIGAAARTKPRERSGSS